MASSSGRRRHKRPRPQTSCAPCHRRKVKCNNQSPCDQCIKHGCRAECHFDSRSGDIQIRSRRHVSAEPSTNNSARDTVWPTGASNSRSQGNFTHNDDYGMSAIHRWLRHKILENAPPSWTAERSNGGPSMDTPDRGKTHSAWASRLLDPLLVFVDDLETPDNQASNQGAFLRKHRHFWSRQFAEGFPMTPRTTIYDELPPSAASCDLVRRYFDTFGSVYPFIDKDEFGLDFNRMLAHPGSVRVRFVIQVLLMEALANATYSPRQAPIPRATTLGWVSLASSTPTTALELEELDLETLRLIALLNLAKQTLKFNETADYVYSGAGIRSAMVLGLHNSEFGNDQEPSTLRKRCLWNTVCDLDLHACLAAGVAPTIPYRAEDDGTSKPISGDWKVPSSSVGQQPSIALQDVLARSLSVRYQIVIALNSEKSPHFESMIRMGRELTRTMAPVSSNKSIPDAQRTFQYNFAAFVYRKFLLALHRPFSAMPDPSFYLSRSIAVQHSKQLLKDVSTAYNNQSQMDSFAALIIGPGTLFKGEVIKAVFTLSHELFRDQDYEVDTRALLNSHDEGLVGIRAAIEESIMYTEESMKTNELAAKTYLAASLASAHFDAIEHFPQDSEDYRQYMFRVGSRLAERFYRLIALED